MKTYWLYTKISLGQSQGDDGGPLNNYRDEEQEWFAIGVAWLGDKTTECQSSGKPNLYARVSHYVDWIYNKTEIPPTPRPTTTTTTTTTTTPEPTTEDPNAFSCKYKITLIYFTVHFIKK